MVDDALRMAIREAFRDAAYPGDGRIVSHSCWECDEVAGKLKGTCWEDWADQPGELCMRGGGIFLLAPESFRYFLPAYLIASLKDRNNYISDAVIAALIDPKYDQQRIHTSHPDPNWYWNRFRELSVKQIDAIKLYLASLPPEADSEGDVTLALKSISTLNRGAE